MIISCCFFIKLSLYNTIHLWHSPFLWVPNSVWKELPCSEQSYFHILPDNTIAIKPEHNETNKMIWVCPAKTPHPSSWIRVFAKDPILLQVASKDFDQTGRMPCGPRQANLVLIAYASSKGSGEPAHPRGLARTFAARSYKQWIKRNLQTESQIPGPSEWLGMRSWNLSWRNARRHKFAWRGPCDFVGFVILWLNQCLLVGVTSWGGKTYEGCAEPSEPGAYTDVSHYTDWIYTNIFNDYQANSNWR